MEAYRERDAMGRERMVFRTVEQAKACYGNPCAICGQQGGRLYDDMVECLGVYGCAKKALQQVGEPWQSIEGQIEDENERARR